MARTKFSIEKAFEELDEILERLDDPKLSLSDSMEYYKKGVKLLEKCNQTLDKTEKKLLCYRREKMEVSLKEKIEKRTKEVEEVIYSFLPEETGYQKTVISAMNYTIRAGGKRLRPMLMDETYRMFGGSDRSLIEPFMAAIEMIHTYSLIHDDLPPWTMTITAGEERLPMWCTGRLWRSSLVMLC